MRGNYVVRKGFQFGLSSKDRNLWKPESREAKAGMILAVLESEFGKSRLKKMSCLDYGCSTGIIANYLAPNFRKITGADIDAKALAFAKKNSKRNAEFVLYNGKRLPFPDSSFDLVLCQQVYEHVPSHSAMVSEISRVLRPKGAAYFSGGNRLMLVEGHYNLPFLSWLPRSLANAYVRACGKGEQYYEKHLSYWGLKRLFRGFEIRDYTMR
ncbi:MAG: class I SAM-dependent methyltransferase, partial [archaeon]